MKKVRSRSHYGTVMNKTQIFPVSITKIVHVIDINGGIFLAFKEG